MSDVSDLCISCFIVNFDDYINIYLYILCIYCIIFIFFFVFFVVVFFFVFFFCFYKDLFSFIQGCQALFMPPTSEKLRGHIGLGLSVCPSVCLSVILGS